MSTSPPGRPPIQLDRIISTAITLVDSEGVEALTMRALATRLRSGTATLYRHFAGRSELVAHVVDSVMGEARSDGDHPDLTWQSALEIAAQDMFDVLCRHPNVAMLMVEDIPVGRNALALRERALTKLLDSGFEPHLAVRTWSTLARYVLGFATQVGNDGRQPAPWADVDLAEFPSSVTVSEYSPIPLSEEFTFGLTMLIIGFDTLTQKS